MPFLNLITNVKIADAKAFALEFSKFAAETLGKPEAYMSDSLDNINREVNEKYSKAFFDFFQKKLDVPTNRGYVAFVDPGRANLGYEGTTFATIFGKD
ncbi:Tautomerase/MIF [Phlegmacium glaucopus]|nr:Tautomerase/MIF [Phlegmacium glaucopus]